MKYEQNTIKQLMAADLKKAAIFIPLILLYMVMMNLLFDTSCPMVIMTGLPCPGCGITRAFKLLLAGRFIEALKFQPMILAVIVLAVMYGWNRYFVQKPVAFMQKYVIISIVAAVLLYVCRMATMFPNTAPMIYEPNNLLSMLAVVFGRIL